MNDDEMGFEPKSYEEILADLVQLGERYTEPLIDPEKLRKAFDILQESDYFISKEEREWREMEAAIEDQFKE